MSRGLLGGERLAELAKELPDMSTLKDLVLHLIPDFLPIKFSHDSVIPIAAVCLHDALHTVEEANYAFHEILAHRKWYLDVREAPNEAAAIFFTKFYTDDVALRLYSASEHLANAIVQMLEISQQSLENHRKKNRSSLQVVVGHYLIKERPTHPITQAVCKLVGSKSWRKALKYRNDWVHNQPPTVAGLGLVYKRRKRWIVSANSIMLTGGGGDEPDYRAEDLISFIRPALFLFVETLTEVARIYTELVVEKGRDTI